MWTNRNEFVFNNRCLEAKEVVDRASRILGDFQRCNYVHKVGVTSARLPSLPWQRPRPGIVKIYVDASVWKEVGFVGIGLVVRYDQGAVLAPASKTIWGSFSPHIAEALGTREGILLAQCCGLEHWILESDAVNVIWAIQWPSSRAPESNVIADIKKAILHAVSGKACYISCRKNSVVHFLTNLVLQNFGDLLCYEFVPLVLRPFVLSNIQVSE